MQELRVYVCETSEGSRGVRSFMLKNYTELTRLNPRLPFVCRNADGVKASACVRYDWGNEREFDLEDLAEEQVEETLQNIVALGETMEKSPESMPKDRDIIDEIDVRLRKDVH